VQFSNSPVGVSISPFVECYWYLLIISSSNNQQMVTYSNTRTNADLVPLRISDEIGRDGGSSN
jgi:hypothetical protein